MKITERDKKLLVLLAVVIILAGSWQFGISPLQNLIYEQEMEIEQLSMQKQEMESNIVQKPSLTAAKERVEKELSEKSSKYKDVLYNQEVDKEFTNLAIQLGLDCTYMNMNMPKDCLQIDNYEYYMEKKPDNPITSVTDKQDSGESETEQQVLNFYAPMVSMTLAGEHAKLLQFMDEITKNRKDIQILGFHFQKDYQYESEMQNEVMNIDMAIYTIDRTIKSMQSADEEQEETQEAGEE